MSTVPIVPTPELSSSEAPLASPAVHGVQATVAVCLPSMPADDLGAIVRRLHGLFPEESLVIATPDHGEEQAIAESNSVLVPYPVQRTDSEWVLNAVDYTAAARVAEQRGTSGVLLLGSDAGSLRDEAIFALRQALANQVDVVVPKYRTGPQEALVNSALLDPLTRALFGADIRFPLPLDAALSTRMLHRLASVASRAGAPMEDGLVWPVAEASIAGYSVRQAEAGERALPRPQEADLNVLFPAVTSSLFSDIENKANFWQRARTLPVARQFITSSGTLTSDEAEEIRTLVEAFRLAFSNLREIWSLVLPPQSLLALKKLSLSSPESFTFPPSLWARTVYDFALAFHLRTLNRGHLLGAFTPLYLAWVAGLLREGGGEALVEGMASAFEQEKPYLVSRWRWPDRFNP